MSCHIVLLTIVILTRNVLHRDLHSFPTRRSSDLLQRRGALAGTEQRRQPSGILVASEIAKAGRQIGRRRQQYRSEEHTSELQSRFDLVCRLLLEKKNIFRSRL